MSDNHIWILHAKKEGDEGEKRVILRFEVQPASFTQRQVEINQELVNVKGSDVSLQMTVNSAPQTKQILAYVLQFVGFMLGGTVIGVFLKEYLNKPKKTGGRNTLRVPRWLLRLLRTTAKNSVFISYQREDSAEVTGRIYDRWNVSVKRLCLRMSTRCLTAWILGLKAYPSGSGGTKCGDGCGVTV